MFKHRLNLWVLIACLSVGVWNLGHGAYLYAKAALAQHLLRQAWDKTLSGRAPVKPWPWADTFPVARLIDAKAHVDLIVLAGASGRSMAFGPGHIDGTALPGKPGNSVLSAHRDTHFAFLRGVRIGDALQIETPAGETLRYRVANLQIVDQHDVRVLQSGAADQLTLVTCYPFDALRPGGPLRYVVSAARVVEG